MADYDIEEYNTKEIFDDSTMDLEMRLIGLYLGSLSLRVSSFRAAMVITFDGALNDGVPYLIHMFNRLKARRPYAFADFDDEQFFLLAILRMMQFF